MKYNVRIDDQEFNVEVVDVNSRPIRVNLDGETFEVWPELLYSGQKEEKPVSHPDPSQPTPDKKSPAPAVTQDEIMKASTDRTKALLAPIPGIIMKITVQVGTEVEYGQQLCVLDAMKMSNIIRSPRAGIISAIHVSEGKQVKHGDLLMEFA
jgi:glutaconyl-CoA/methylmalonyl-CoA decarboxylase subunit gamma